MILGIDPGLATCGWAVLDSAGRVADLGLIASAPNRKLDESTDRARRAAAQSDILRDVARRHHVRTIACEAMSFGGPPSARFAMAVSLGLSWGVVTDLAIAIGAGLYSIAPKLWQHAIQPGSSGAGIDYPKLEAAIAKYVGQHAVAALALIPESKRNHPLDAVGIGLFAALRREQADRIVNERAAA